MEYVDKVYAISQDGSNHLKELSFFCYKIYHAYLGSNDYQIGNLVTMKTLLK